MEAYFDINDFFSQNIRRSNFIELKFPGANLEPVKRYSHLVCGPKMSQNMLYWWEPKHAIWKEEDVACYQTLGEACN